MNWFQSIGLLAFFGALFYLWFMVKTRRGFGAWLHQRRQHREIQMVEYFGLAGRSSLTLVEVRGQAFMVAQSPTNIQVVPVPATTSESEKISTPILTMPAQPR